jgi:RNA polymerase sigma factor (sigma-70 family)
LNERDLVIACQRHDPKAQTAFYNLYKGRLLGVCRRYARTEAEAEDIFQEAFIKIFNNLHNLEKPESVAYWVKSSVIRTAIDHYRQNQKEKNNVDYDSIIDEPHLSPSIFENLNRDQVITIINELPDGYRVVVNLFLIDGYSHAEIGAMLGVSEGTSKSQLSRAKELLRIRLKEIGIVSAVA